MQSIILICYVFVLRYCGDFLPDDIISTGEEVFLYVVTTKVHLLLLMKMLFSSRKRDDPQVPVGCFSHSRRLPAKVQRN